MSEQEGKNNKASRLNRETAPFFSIITVCRNEENTIEGTMDSVLQQADRDLEYIFIDGNSEDRTCDLIRRKMEASRLPYQLVSEKDAGIYDAMNKGVQLSRGQYLYFINCKDLLHDSHVLADLHQALQRQPETDILYGNVVFCYPERTIMCDYVSGKRLNYRRIALEQYVCHQAVAARRQLYIAHPLDTSFRVLGDNEWLAYWSRQKAKIGTIDELICDFDMTGTSQQNAGSPQALWEADEIARRYCKPVYYLTRPLKAVARALRNK